MKTVMFYRYIRTERNDKGELIEETLIDPNHPPIFLISEMAIDHMGSHVVSEITVWSLLWMSIIYSFKKPYYWVLRKIRTWGFLTTRPECVLSLKDFTLLFWKHRIKKKDLIHYVI